ncbi:MAG: HAD hydrolase family protein [Betaproteobacteria bacterium]|nr:HAD hydrolase family protein [Betaproteobacteria bacterium]MDE2423349.1 HAD hydrolase family protein [Betaproteobacteria bacterium]
MTTALKTLSHRTKLIRLIGFDVDGIMTNGQLHFSSNGEEIKSFHVRDGLGIKLLQRIGIEACIITGRQSNIVETRAKELGIHLVYQGVDDKLTVFKHIIDEKQLSWEECAYMGDDLQDLPILKRCGISLTVPEAPPLIRNQVDWIASIGGGQGAVRQAAEFLLSSRGQWQEAIAPWLV